jgi:hypothetical protein
MGPFFVVQTEACPESLSKIRTVFKLVEIEILVLHSPPKSFDENIVLPKFSMIEFFWNSTLLANTLNNQSRNNHNAYDLDTLLILPGDPPAQSQSSQSQPSPPTHSACPLPSVLPLAGGAVGDHKEDHEAPARSYRLDANI